MQNKVLLFYGYALKNSGDMAITEGAIDLLLSRGCDIKLIMRYNKSNWEYKESVDYLKDRYSNEKIGFYESPFSLDRNKGLINQVINYCDGFLKIIGLKKANELVHMIQWADEVYFNGGNLLRCKSNIDYARLRALFYAVPYAIKYKKPYSILPNSCSTLNRIGRNYLEYVVKNAKFIFMREEESYFLFKKIFYKYCSKIILSTDLAYFINTEKDPNSNFKINKSTIAITLRAHGIGDIKELEAKEMERICCGVENLIQSLLENNHNVCIVVQTKKDKSISNLIHGRFQDYKKLSIMYERNPHVLRQYYSKVDLLIGMRLHSIILATSMGTPAVGYFMKEWGLKNPGLMKTLNLPFYDVVEDDISYSIISNLIQNRNDYAISMKANNQDLMNNLTAVL